MCHNSFKATRKTDNKPKTKIIATIKARILTDLADAIRAEWHKVMSFPQDQQHAQIVKFAAIWCSDAQGYNASRVKIMCSPGGYSLEDSDANAHTLPSLSIDFNNLTARPLRPGETFLAGLRARNFMRRGLRPPPPPAAGDDGGDGVDPPGLLPEPG